MPRITHGHTIRSGDSKTTPEYAAWNSMRQRCRDKNHEHFHSYGGRGIKVCRRWADSFENFLADIGPRPSPQHSLDRYPDNDGDYEPGNCRWATSDQQHRNERRNIIVQFRGQEMVLIDAARAAGIKYQTVWKRIRRYGWHIDRALSEPTRG